MRSRMNPQLAAEPHAKTQVFPNERSHKNRTSPTGLLGGFLFEEIRDRADLFFLGFGPAGEPTRLLGAARTSRFWRWIGIQEIDGFSPSLLRAILELLIRRFPWRVRLRSFRGRPQGDTRRGPARLGPARLGPTRQPGLGFGRIRFGRSNPLKPLGLLLLGIGQGTSRQPPRPTIGSSQATTCSEGQNQKRQERAVARKTEANQVH